ncbi:hypothetical protein FF38_11613 [Lucilia cuprina]|uniref:Uncharacterized protein n=1 Tax=Lucilia cuprina TaxID=7375 RepID=A0A0L0BVF8_LUCCU|nr:hypothetical protein CVS40_10864 [Lucilia cuprina]KNC24006.1 hypothetical protein FF38_11613 [Lucilia cuprina]
MKTRQLSNRLLVVMILVCCSQQIWAGVVKGSKGKNSTVAAKSSSQTTKQPKVSHKTKSTTTTTTAKPEMETTTLPVDIDLDGRSAFINNQYVADPEQPIPDTTPPLYELLQQQMETVLSNTGSNIQVYANDGPQMKEVLDNGVAGDESQKPPGKPIFGYDMGQFDDYDEEDVNEYSSEGEYIPDNCEDTQESLGDNDGSYVGAEQLTHGNLPALQNNYGQDNTERNIFEQSTPNKPYDSSNYGPQSSNNQGTNYNQNKPHESNNYGSQTNTNQAQSYGNNSPQNGYSSTKPSTQQHNHKLNNKSGSKSKPSQQYNNNQNNQKTSDQYPQSSTNQYVQNNQKPLTNQNSYNKPPQQQYNTVKPSQNSYNQQKPLSNNRPYSKPTTQQQTKPVYSKPNQVFNTKLSHNTNYPIPSSTTLNNNYNNTETLSSPYGNFNTLTTTSLNPSLTPNFSYGNSNSVTSSPFSGQNNKLPNNGSKRHLTFRTVSSSTQYVSTPLADLMFKFSIGMAKHGTGKLGNNAVNNQAQVFNVLNDIDAKTE